MKESDFTAVENLTHIRSACEHLDRIILNPEEEKNLDVLAQIQNAKDAMFRAIDLMEDRMVVEQDAEGGE